MKTAYELRYGTVHCTGRFIYTAGTVAYRDAAAAWCAAGNQDADGVAIPETDPLCWCPVRHCHMKRQRPWRDFREIILPAGEGSQSPEDD